MAAVTRRYVEYAKCADVIRTIWQTRDANASTLLEHDELKAALADLEKTNYLVRKERCKSGANFQKIDDDTTASIMRATDSDADGALDRNDFMQAMILWRKIAKDRDRLQQKQAASGACALM